MKRSNYLTSIGERKPITMCFMVFTRSVNSIRSFKITYEAVMENWCIRVNEKVACLDMSHGSAHHTVHNILQFHKFCARWVPRHLTAELKTCWYLQGTSVLPRICRWNIAKKNSHWRWNLCPLSPTWNQESN